MPYNEADTRAKLIDPALRKCGWTEDHIKREESAGAIYIVGKTARKQAKGRLDYTLRVAVNSQTQPVAVALIEAKAEHLPPNNGLEQAKLYADSKRFNVPFVFSTNGHLFVCFDKTTELTSSPDLIVHFPSPDELRARYEKAMGFALNDVAARPLLARYIGGESGRRYYQDAAIRAVFEKLALCERSDAPRRALLSLATGAGKTFIAVALLRKVADAGQLKRALFICDRDELRKQAAAALQNSFGADAQPVTGGQSKKNARVLIATYQTLGAGAEQDDATFLVKNYPPDYFSHIVIDECHRSAWGKWSEVFKHNPNAIQIGLTATPRQLQVGAKTLESEEDSTLSSDNIRHFGEPVYEYDVAQGIEDGYLAACEIIKGKVDIDDTGISIDQVFKLGPTHATTGQKLTRDQLQQIYEKTDYEERILLPDRVHAMCADLFASLLETGGPEQKTVIFCARDRHADDVATNLNNLYAKWCVTNGKPILPHFAFKCTAAAGSDYLADLRGAARHHFIACTVDLLSTGVDVPNLRNVVFFKYLKSPILFYQMVGRGTRLDAKSGKLMFRLYDYTNATRLFGEAFLSKLCGPRKLASDEDAGAKVIEIATVQGLDVEVTPAGHLILTQIEGKAVPIPLEEYRSMIAARVIEIAPDADKFRGVWASYEGRAGLLRVLPDGPQGANLVRYLSDMTNYDLYDVLGELTYGLTPRTRAQRAAAFEQKHATWLDSLAPGACKALKTLAAQFAKGGIEAFESESLFAATRVNPRDLQSAGKPSELVREVKERMLSA